MTARPTLRRLALSVAPFVLTFVTTGIIVLMMGANPLAAYGNLLGGALESSAKWADVGMAMVPLMLAACGMLITFTAGLWNIGVEGQMRRSIDDYLVVESVKGPAPLMLAAALPGWRAARRG